MAGISWKKRRRQLPKNYVQLVQADLLKLGIDLKPSKITDVIRGKVRNPELSIKVWGSIGQIEEKYTKLRNKADKLKKGTLRA